MRNKATQIGIGMVLILVLVVSMLLARTGSQTPMSSSGASPAKAGVQRAAASGKAVLPAAAAQGDQPSEKRLPNGVRVVNEVKHDTSPPLRDIPPAARIVNEQENENPLPFALPQTSVKDTVVQNFFGPLAMPTPILTFDGITSVTSGCGCLPPDTNGDVGPNHYVQTVNSAFQIWDKNGTVVQTARQINTIFAGFGGPCQNRNDGDPIALYDELADRWFISQFTSASPYGMCIAVSTSPDPTGSYNRYFFQLSVADFYDYEKYGVWPDAYYMSANVFEGAGGFHPSAVAFDRTRMLAGLSATYQEFNPGSFYASLLPSDMDGAAPPAGSPNYFVSTSNTISEIYFWKFHVDWAVPANSSFAGPTSIPVAPFDPNMCGGARQCIPQAGTAVKIDAIADRAMYRLAYRNMGSYEALVVNHTVDENSADHAGIRWYELRNPNSSPTLYQQGTYAPDAAHRWMGSMAMDRDGNIALGYSTSSSTLFPSIRYAGRLSTDPLGQLSQGEATMIAGTGSQTSSSGRWGDYSAMSVDPSDGCTFWYTQEYYSTTSGAGWKTRIGKFMFPGCGTGPTPTVGTPAPSSTVVPASSTPLPLPTSCANYTVAATAGNTIVPGTQDIGIHCDDCGLQITLPFAVKLYEQLFTTVNVTSNGVLSFTGSNFAFGNSCLPVVVYNHAIYGFWDDLITNTGSDGVFSATTGTAPNRTFYLEFRAKSLDVASAPVNFEFVLHEGGGPNFEVIYGLTVAGNGSAATTGVQRDSTYYTQYSCNSPTILPGTKLSYTKQVCPVATATSTVLPTNTVAPTNTPGVGATATATHCAINFVDVPVGDTFYPFVRCLACRGIINGYPCGGAGEPCNTNNDPYFRPGNAVSRGQLAKIVAQSANLNAPVSGQSFEDVVPGTAFYTFTERLYAIGAIGGYQCGIAPTEPCFPPANRPYYRPGASVTRGQLTKIVAIAAGFTNPAPNTYTFTDVQVGSTFHIYVEQLLLNRPGVMQGYPCGGVNPQSGQAEPCDSQSRPYFRVNNTLSRAQASKIVANTFFPNCQTPAR